MGYFEIGVYHPKSEVNVGSLWRSAFQLGAAGIFTIGHRYKRQHSDTYKTQLQIPLRNFANFEEFLSVRPCGALLIAVEMGGKALTTFSHPKQAVYLLGAEDHGLPEEIMKQCNDIVSLEAIKQQSYNVAIAGSILMYHRQFGLLR